MPLLPRGLWNKMVGDVGERRAAKVLRQAGMRVVARNWRAPCGEIDLIARAGKTIVFVEVKTRSGDQFGAGDEAVDSAKQRQIARAATVWIARYGRDHWSYRFDVVVVDAESGAATHYEHAFESPLD